MQSKNRLLGVIAALGISLTAGLALPMVNVLKQFSTSELMTVRGGIAALFVGMIFRKRIRWSGWGVITFSVLFASANFCLYNGIRRWGANPTIVIITLTPLVNFVAKWWRGERTNKLAFLSLLALVGGVVVALEPWNAPMDALGVAWSLGGTILQGVGFEVLAKTTNHDPRVRGFWFSIVICMVGFTGTLAQGKLPLITHEFSQTTFLLLLGFGFTGGFLYFLSIVFAFDYLDTEVASVLAMGETPAVILGAGVLLGEKMSFVQWVGVIIALAATAALSYAEAKKSTSQASEPAA